MCPIWEPLIAAHSFRVPWGREIGLKQPGKGFSLGSSCSGVLPFPFSFPPSPSLSRCSPSSGDPVPEGHWLCKKKGDQWVNELIWHCPRAGLGYVKPSQSTALSGCVGLRAAPPSREEDSFLPPRPSLGPENPFSTPLGQLYRPLWKHPQGLFVSWLPGVPRAPGLCPRGLQGGWSHLLAAGAIDPLPCSPKSGIVVPPPHPTGPREAQGTRSSRQGSRGPQLGGTGARSKTGKPQIPTKAGENPVLGFRL